MRKEERGRERKREEDRGRERNRDEEGGRERKRDAKKYSIFKIKLWVLIIVFVLIKCSLLT